MTLSAPAWRLIGAGRAADVYEIDEDRVLRSRSPAGPLIPFKSLPAPWCGFRRAILLLSNLAVPRMGRGGPTGCCRRYSRPWQGVPR